MSTWENELFSNGLWLDTSNPNLNILKKYDASSQTWIPTSATKAEDVGTYSANDIDTKIGTLKQTGTSGNRPTSNAYVGMPFFDTTLGKPIWCHSLGNPNIWVDSTGANV